MGRSIVGGRALLLLAALAWAAAAEPSRHFDIPLPAGARRLADADSALALLQALDREAADSQLTARGIELIGWAVDGRGAGGGQVRDALAASLRNAGFQLHELGGEPCGDATVSAFLALNAGTRQGLTGYWYASADGLVLAWAELRRPDGATPGRPLLPIAALLGAAPALPPAPPPASPSAQPSPAPAPSAAPAPAATPAPAAAPAPKLPALAAQPHRVKGRCVDLAGRPLPNARVEVRGMSLAGQRADFSFDATDGAFDAEVPDGVYRVTASTQLTYSGRLYILPLQPLDGARDDTNHGTREGVAKDFVLRFHGPDSSFERMGAEYHGSYCGGWLEVCNPYSFVEGPQPTLTLTLTPDGPLMDGSAGTTLVYRMDFAQSNWKEVLDIPLGRYRITALETAADGRTRPRAFTIRSQLNQFHSEPATEHVLEFPPAGMAEPGVEGVKILVEE